nr:DUF6551 family protein [Brucella anthropi]DAM62883.1 MAG TPA: Stage 0 sporulation protein J, Chromosome segregation, Chromosome organization [Caudoviricetes sp.]
MTISKRPIAALNLPDLEAAVLDTLPPEIRYVKPGDLFVNETYQRALSDRSLRLIRKIVAEWSWRAFKPPVVVEVDGTLEIIDGQHTAIGAVTHGGIDKIPVLVVEAAASETRASAFVRHNRDRIQVTPVQLHSALVEAGDEDALTIKQVCERAGIKILKNPPPFARFKIGETMAISTIAALVKRRHALGARRVLEICHKTNMAPVSAGLIRAVEHLVFAKEYQGEIDVERIPAVVIALGPSLDVEAARFAAERKVPVWRAIASVIYMNRRKKR